MDIRFGTQARFEAAHHPKGVPSCEGTDGHSYTVWAFCEGPLEPTSTGIRRVRGSEGLPEALRVVCAELSQRVLEDMMPGVLTTPEGIAAWFLERLPAAQEIRVSIPRETVEVRRKVR